MPLRICDITMFYPDVNAGGVKTYILNKKRFSLQQTPHVHATIAPGTKTQRTVSEEKRDYFYEIRTPRVPWNPTYHFFTGTGAIKDALMDFKPDLVEIGDAYFTPWIVKSIYKREHLSRSLKPKLVGFYHDDFPRAYVEWFLKPRSQKLSEFFKKKSEDYVRYAYNALDGCIASTTTFHDWLVNLGVKNVELAPFGVDTELFSPLPAQPSSSVIKCLYVGRISSEKRIAELLTLFDSAHLIRPDLTLTLVGSGPLEQKVKDSCMNKPHITLIPHVGNRAELARIYASHDVLLVPRVETFGLAALEAMACGTPVACLTGLSGAEMFVTSQTGFPLGEKIDAFFPFLTTVTKEDILHMKEKSRKLVEKSFEQKKMFHNLFSVYEKFCAKD